MAKTTKYKLMCKNHACGHEFERVYTQNEYEQKAYGGDRLGISCFDCGYPSMQITISNRRIKDTFEPGLSRVFNRHFGTKQEYEAYLKRNGLVTLGNEEFTVKEENHRMKWTKGMAKKGAEIGLSDRELDRLVAGKTISDESALKENMKRLDNYEKDLAKKTS